MKPISLKEVIDFAWEYSDFYREFWGRRNFIPERDFRVDDDLKKIPILTKEDLLSVSTKKRSITRSKDHYYFAALSSGTVKDPLVCLQPRFAMPSYYRFVKDLVQVSDSSVLVLRPGTHAMALIAGALPEEYFLPGSIIALGDMDDLTFSAHLAQEIEMNWLVAKPSDAIRFAPILQQQGYPLSHIKFLHITGEPLTAATISLIKSLYPDACTVYIYAMTEVPAAMGLKSSLCADLDAVGSNAYHLNTEDFIFEVVDGLSVITALHEIPTPLIRYSTGDRILIKEKFQCSCGFNQDAVVIVGPRAGETSYKIGGFIFQVDAIKKVLQKLPEFVVGDFQLHIEQIAKDGRLSNLLRLVVKPVGSPTPFLTSTIREILERELYVTRYRLLKWAIQQGLIDPLLISYDTDLKGSSIIPPLEIIKPFHNLKKK
ncbi:MAG: hypothetical protein HYT40_02890 [Candidatus Sungbacteria bacterium]|uniref:Phenylacetate--CoA ligase family protein n=1 Tax=Candidatus Sungiibacteriota bacterium TaxID=2750080 RepID=A0A931SBX2_9BACT|nr:hypothetical protein [Candidatus Sungbacteria bacterium]